VARRDNRPLLRGVDPKERFERIKRMLSDREPIYSQADLVISSEDGPHSQAVEHVVSVLKERGVYEEP
jgi:shikimate kinase